MPHSDNKESLSRREILTLRAMDTFYPPKTNNKANALAVIIAIDDYDNDPSKQAEILKELATPAARIKRLQEAHDIYCEIYDTKHLIEVLSDKMEDGFKKQDSANKEQTDLLLAAEKRAAAAEETIRRQEPWVRAGKILSGIISAALAICTILGVPQKYSAPLIDNIIDPILEKIGLITLDKTPKAEETPQQPAPLQQNKSEATPPPPKQEAPQIKETKPETFGPDPKSNRSSLKAPPHDGKQACTRPGAARKLSYRTYHV